MCPQRLIPDKYLTVSTKLKQNIEVLLEQFISFSLASKDNVTAFILEFQQEFRQLIVKLVKKNTNTITCPINTFRLHAHIFLHTDPVIVVVLLQCAEPAIPVKFPSAFYSAFQKQTLVCSCPSL